MPNSSIFHRRSIKDAVNGEIPFGPLQQVRFIYRVPIRHSLSLLTVPYQFLLAIQLALGVGLSVYMVQLGRSSLESSTITTEEVVEVVEVIEEMGDEEGGYIDEQDGPEASPEAASALIMRESGMADPPPGSPSTSSLS